MSLRHHRRARYPATAASTDKVPRTHKVPLQHCSAFACKLPVPQLIPHVIRCQHRYCRHQPQALHPSVLPTLPCSSTSAIGDTMTSVDLGRYKNRIVQYFWDPEPKNDDMSHSPIWCLGREYATPASPNGTSVDETSHNQDSAHLAQESSLRESSVADDSIINSFEHVPGPDETSQPTDPDKPWPAPFLDDFESRLWLTYRSNFEPIPKSQSPNAAAAMTFSARIRSQLVDQAGFTSDTGWGCMIRSGQSLLANTLIMLRLGRGGCYSELSSRRELTEYRLEAGHSSDGREKSGFDVCRRSTRALLNTSLRWTWSFSLWEAPWRMVWAVGDSAMYPVSALRLAADLN